MKFHWGFGGAACAGAVVIAVLGVVEPAMAATIVNDFTISGTAVENDSGLHGIATSSFADFDAAVGTLTGVTLSFTGTANVSGGEGAFADFLGVGPASDVHEVLLIGTGSGVSGNFSIAANGTTDTLSFFEGAGMQALLFSFAVDSGTVTMSPQSGTLTYDYTPASPAVPEPSTWAMVMVGFAGLAYAAFRRGAKVSASIA
jgi:hypothetical protein